MTYHMAYIAHKMKAVLRDEEKLSDYGMALIEYHALQNWGNCELCDERAWCVNRALLLMMHTKAKRARLVSVSCNECGNTKLISLHITMQNEKLRLLKALSAGRREDDDLIHAEYISWRDDQTAPERPAIFTEESPD